ncbi:MAG: hypothetical protein US89_C0010G0018 [Candidatus Peregrinibacteria bacterium GW2011_GWF2_38_29]|nr:MAG: hypothetical protein US89_C0010G0018 [Candidatus Peregrinibacteria bacterium GW2011_GWF2_38_29]
MGNKEPRSLTREDGEVIMRAFLRPCAEALLDHFERVRREERREAIKRCLGKLWPFSKS